MTISLHLAASPTDPLYSNMAWWLCVRSLENMALINQESNMLGELLPGQCYPVARILKLVGNGYLIQLTAEMLGDSLKWMRKPPWLEPEAKMPEPCDAFREFYRAGFQAVLENHQGYHDAALWFDDKGAKDLSQADHPTPNQRKVLDQAIFACGDAFLDPHNFHAPTSSDDHLRLSQPGKLKFMNYLKIVRSTILAEAPLATPSKSATPPITFRHAGAGCL